MTLEKPTTQEDEYFMKLDAERIKQQRAELDKNRAEEITELRKGVHWMKCPKCGQDLEEVNYQNILIDKCNDCHGIWLDQGELDLLATGEARVTKGFLNKLFG
jgi:hypothetical protein